MSPGTGLSIARQNSPPGGMIQAGVEGTTPGYPTSARKSSSAMPAKNVAFMPENLPQDAAQDKHGEGPSG